MNNLGQIKKYDKNENHPTKEKFKLFLQMGV